MFSRLRVPAAGDRRQERRKQTRRARPGEYKQIIRELLLKTASECQDDLLVAPGGKMLLGLFGCMI
jgi:hypothetical protein